MKSIFWQAKNHCKLPTNAMHAHASEDQVKPPIVKPRQRRARFNRHGMDAIIEKIDADDAIRLRESRIGRGAITASSG